MDNLDPEAQQRRETFARYGLAMYHAQCVEKSLAILVSTVLNKEFLPSDPKRREEIQDEVFSETIGKLLTRMRKEVSVPRNLNKTLDDTRRKRNWLAHEYFWARAGEIMTNRGRDRMIGELTELSDFFSKVDAHLVAIYEQWMKRLGLTQEIINATNIEDSHLYRFDATAFNGWLSPLCPPIVPRLDRRLQVHRSAGAGDHSRERSACALSNKQRPLQYSRPREAQG